MSSKITKQELSDLVKKTLEFADQEGMLDDLCSEGMQLINKLREAVDAELVVPRLDIILTTDDFKSNYSNYYDDTDFNIVVKFHGKEVPIYNIEINDSF